MALAQHPRFSKEPRPTSYNGSIYEVFNISIGSLLRPKLR